MTNYSTSQSPHDPHMRVVTLASTPKPQTCIWFAHQDYYEGAIADLKPPSEQEAGEWVKSRFMKPKHYGPLEHPAITFNVIGWPHATMQQARTHRTGVTFDVCSGRYTGKRLVKLVEDWHESNSNMVPFSEVEKLFYVRPVGAYSSRSGQHYFFNKDRRLYQLRAIWVSIQEYAQLLKTGFSEEHAADVLPWRCIRQNFVVSFNARSLLHFFAMRSSKEAQLECQWLCDSLLEEALKWAPEVMSHYKEKHYGKTFIAP